MPPAPFSLMNWNKKTLPFFLLFFQKLFLCTYLSVSSSILRTSGHIGQFLHGSRSHHTVIIALWSQKFFDDHFLILILAKTIVCPVLHFLDIFFKIEKIIASQSVLSSLSPNVLTENRTDHYMTRSHLLRIANRNWESDHFLGYFWWFREPGSYSEFSDFQNLSVLSNFFGTVANLSYALENLQPQQHKDLPQSNVVWENQKERGEQ